MSSFFLLMKINTKIGVLITFELCFVFFSPAALLVGYPNFLRQKSARKTENVNSLGSNFVIFKIRVPVACFRFKVCRTVYILFFFFLAVLKIYSPTPLVGSPENFC